MEINCRKILLDNSGLSIDVNFIKILRGCPEPQGMWILKEIHVSSTLIYKNLSEDSWKSMNVEYMKGPKSLKYLKGPKSLKKNGFSKGI